MPRVIDLWPKISAEVQHLLRTDGYGALADQISDLELTEMCRCGDSFCDSFFTAPRPDGAWEPRASTIELEPSWPGYLLIDVQGTAPERIVEVEVLYRGGLS